MWAKKYPILTTYRQEVKDDAYVTKLQAMLTRLQQEYRYNAEEAFLVLKDILAQIWNARG